MPSPLLGGFCLGKVSAFFSFFVASCEWEVADKGVEDRLLELFVSEPSNFSGEDLFLFLESSDQFLLFSGLFCWLPKSRLFAVLAPLFSPVCLAALEMCSMDLNISNPL